ncbi:hypothetical protein KR044_012262, partial [Drosophila immigrans]
CRICNFMCKNHLALDSHHINHQLNRHFCRNGCGCWCNTLDEILEHEYRQHPVGLPSHFSCRICHLEFRSAINLSSHMATHCYERRFVCAICRRHYESFEELQVHRQYSRETCGRIEYADGQDNIGELVAGSKVNAIPLEFRNMQIKAEPLDMEEQQLPEATDIIIKMEPKDDTVVDGWPCVSIPQKLRGKLRLPAIKKPDVKVETAVYSSPSIKFNKLNQMSLLAQQVGKRPNILKPTRKIIQTPKSNPTVAPNVLKALPTNCMLFKLPANTKIVKISSNTTQSSGSSNSAVGSKIITLSTPTQKITPPVSSNNRNAYFSDLSQFESTPESRKIIEDIKNQIRNIEQTCPLPGSVLQVPKQSTPVVVPNQPKDVYNLPLTRNSSTMLRELRIEHPRFRFHWECPHCARYYEQYSAFCKHLIFSHNVEEANLGDMMVHVKSEIVTVKSGSVVDTSDVPTAAAPAALTPVSAAVAAKTDQPAVTDVTQKQTPSAAIPAASIPSPAAAAAAPVSPTSAAAGQPKRIIPIFRPPQYPCEDCSKCFTTVGALRIHKMIHTGELPHKCDYCDKRFRTPGQVRVHQRRHTGEKPFKCKVCSLAFTHRETLISHLSRHIGMKRYKCYGCDKNFVVVSGLRAHRRLRPDTCGKVKFTARAHGPRVRVIRGEVFFESHPEYNGYLRSEDPLNILSEMNHVDMESDEPA